MFLKNEKQNVTKMLGILIGLSVALGACSPLNESSSGPQQDATLNAKIVNGVEVGAADPLAQSTVALYLNNKSISPDFMNFCTGTLIDKDIVMTAAHCFADFSDMVGTTVSNIANSTVIAFGIPIVSSSTDSHLQYRKIKAVSIHSKYVINGVQQAETVALYDVALIRLDSAAPATAKVASLVTDKKVLKKGLALTLVGFGLTDGVQQVEAKQMMKVNVNVDNPAITAAQFTYKVVNRKGSCSGDSGGPAYLANVASGKVQVIGVTSWGDVQCTELGAYTSVPAMASWIKTAQAKLAALK